MRYLISYDLRKPDRDYSPLYDELNSLGAKRIQESVWAVRSTLGPGDIFDKLWPHMENARDRLLVARVGAFRNASGINRLVDV
jgi:hypothetical protein